MLGMPGRSHAGPLPPLTAEGEALAGRLRLHVLRLAAGERNTDLETPARYIESALVAHGLKPCLADHPQRPPHRAQRGVRRRAGARIHRRRRALRHRGRLARRRRQRLGRGGAIELAGLLGAERLPIRFVAFPNEESPYFMTPEMGSWAWARRAQQRGERVLAMFSLEMLGYYRDAPGTQRYPAAAQPVLSRPRRLHRLRRRPRRARAWSARPSAPSAGTPASRPKAWPRPPPSPASPGPTTGPSAPRASPPS